jgi:L-arabinokinase
LCKPQGGIADYSGSAVLQMPIAQACHVAAQLQPAATQPHWKHEATRGGGGGGVALPPALRIVSFGADATGRSCAFDVDMKDLLGTAFVGGGSADGGSGGGAAEPPGAPGSGDGMPSYAAAREMFAREPARSWAAYVGGAALVLAREKGVRFTAGLSLLVQGKVPDGKGVSSSASVEVAAMQVRFRLRLRNGSA